MRILRALPVAASVLLAGAEAPRAEGAVRITTESLEYCEALTVRLSAMPAAGSARPRALWEEGERLCAAGHVRTGIAKLRRAIRLATEMRAEQAAAEGR